MDERKETVNIYLKSESDRAILKGTSPERKYIILQNDQLQAENREMRERINELEVKVNEQEEEEDKRDVSARYTKGLLKNLVELEKMRAEIAVIEKDILQNSKTFISLFKVNAYKHLRILQAILFVMFGILYETEYLRGFQFYMIFIMVAFVIAFTENMIKTLILPVYPDKKLRIDELNTDIKKITDTQDFLSDYIDNL